MLVRRRGPLVESWLVLLLVGLALATPAQAQTELYVTNQQGESTLTPADAVVVYEVAASGVTFKRILRGPATGLRVPSGLALTADKLFVANRGDATTPGSITIYPRTASGDTPPTWTIRSTAATRLDRPFGLVVKDDELFVANQSDHVDGGSVTVYKLTNAAGGPILTTPGDVSIAPDRIIEGPPMSGPTFIAVTADELFVTNNYSRTLTVHPRNARSGQPYRFLLDTGFNPFADLMGLVVDEARPEMFLGHGFLVYSTISVYPPGASGAPGPTRTLSGPPTKLDRPSGLLLTDNYLVVANRKTTNTAGSILVFDRDDFAKEPLELPRDPGRLFSPVALALTPAALSFDYTLTAATPPPVAPGSSVEVKITAGLAVGAGSVTFGAGFPAGISGSFVPRGSFVPETPCALPCETTLRLDASATTPKGSYGVTVRATGTPTVCQGAECAVRHSVALTLVVEEIREGFLQVLKEGPGTGTVRSIVPDGRINCGPVCSAAFPVGTAELTAEADPDSTFSGWRGVSNCDLTRPCRVPISESSTTTVTATFALRPPVELNVTLVGSGAGTVASSPQGQNCTGPTTPPRTSCRAFPSGTTVTLTTGVDPGFAGWLPEGEQPACGGIGACKIALTRNEAVSAYFGTPQEALVARLYLNVLAAIPSPENMRDLIDALTPEPALVVDALLDAFFDGPALRARALTKLTAPAYVAALVRALRGREPEAGERAGLFRPLVTRFTGSPEFQARVARGEDIANSMYQGFLNRPPTPEERARFNASGDVVAVALEILSSDEYAGRRRTVPGIGEDGRMLYRGLLAREAGDPEVQDVIRQLLEQGKNLEDAGRAEFRRIFGELFPE